MIQAKRIKSLTEIRQPYQRLLFSKALRPGYASAFVLCSGAEPGVMGARIRPRTVGRALATLLGLGLLATPASAHQFTTRFDAPVPLGLLYVGAGATVFLSAVLIARLGSTPSHHRVVGTVPRRLVDALRLISRAGFFLAFLAVLIHGLVGPRAPGQNVSTLFTWSIWLKGVALLAVIAGSPWRVFSPWRTVYDGLCRLEGTEIRWRRYPERLGHWPAFLGFVLLVGVVENLTRIPRLPEVTAVVVAAYGLVMLLGAFVFGREWFERADAMEAFYGFLGTVAPLSVHETDGNRVSIVVRYPWQGCTAPVESRTAVAFVVAMVYTVTFDGFAQSPIYREIYFGAQETLGVGGTVSILLYGLGLAAFVGGFVAAATVVNRLLSEGRTRAETTTSRRVDSDGGAAVATPLVLAPTLLPIAAGYEFAHNFSYVLTYVGRLPTVVGGAAVDPLWWLSLPAFWGSQVLLIVGGHVIAVVTADAVVRRLAPTDRWAMVAHAPLLVSMIGYTVLSLWVVSLPVAA